MGSQAQDARNDRLLREAQDKVANLERSVAQEESHEQKAELIKKLNAAKNDLDMQESIDRNRD